MSESTKHSQEVAVNLCKGGLIEGSREEILGQGNAAYVLTIPPLRDPHATTFEHCKQKFENRMNFRGYPPASASSRQHISDAAWEAIMRSDSAGEAYGTRERQEASHRKLGIMAVTFEEFEKTDLHRIAILCGDITKEKMKCRALCVELARLHDAQFTLEAENDRLRRLLHRAENGPPPVPGPKKRWRWGLLP